MAFTGRTRDEIRDELLTQWSGALHRRGKAPPRPRRVLRLPPRERDGGCSLGAEAQAEQTARNILPTRLRPTRSTASATSTGSRASGVRATATVTVTGLSLATSRSPGDADGHPTGPSTTSPARRCLLSAAPPPATSAPRSLAPRDRAVADVLTFVSAPLGLNTTGAVASVVDGSAEESDQHYPSASSSASASAPPAATAPTGARGSRTTPARPSRRRTRTRCSRPHELPGDRHARHAGHRDGGESALHRATDHHPRRAPTTTPTELRVSNSST